MEIGKGRLDELKGSARIYDFDEASAMWHETLKVGGDDYYDRFGGDVDISESGNRIVIGAYSSNNHRGEFDVYEDGGNGEWYLLGRVAGDNEWDSLGRTVAISGDGTHVAVSSPGSDETDKNAGQINIYKYSSNSDLWELQEVSILSGSEMNDKFGAGRHSIAIDQTGKYIAAGADQEIKSTEKGLARVFEGIPASR